MNHLQAEHVREMEEFKSANHGNGSWKLENNNNNNNKILKNNSRADYYYYNNDNNQMRRRPPGNPAPPHHRSNRTSSSSSGASTWNKNKSSSSYKVQRKASSSSWISDPEVKRQRRVVKYKAYAVEGKMKDSIRNGLRWVKNKYCQIVHGC